MNITHTLPRRPYIYMKQILKLATLMSLVAITANALAANVDSAPAFNTKTDSGVYIWRTSGGQWQMRVLGGNGYTHFTGSFRANGAITDVVDVALQAEDILSTNGQILSINFTASGDADIDGVKLKAGGNKLCLRSTGGKVQVRLGKNEVLANTPVDLTGNGACYTPPPTPTEMKGMVMTDKGNGLWHARLVSTDRKESFKGTAEFTENLRWFSRVELENADVLKKPSNKKLDMQFAAWPGGLDGANISINSGSGLCLKATGGDFSQILVVNKNGAATIQTSPVDVTGNGACSGAPTPEPPPPINGNRKYNAGHYVALMRGDDSQSTMAKNIKHGALGLLKRYTWRSLEPSRRIYNFSEMQSDVQFAASQGMQLVVMIEDKTFKNEDPMPLYMKSLSLPNRSGGFTGARWKTFYVNRFNALTAEIGRRFDKNAAFEGVAVQESAPGLDGKYLDASGFTSNGYRDALISIIKTGLNNMPTSRFFWYMNFMPRGLDKMEEVIIAVKDTGAIVGGPDIMPDEESLQKHAYPLYRKYANQLSFFGQVEPICYYHKHETSGYRTKYWTMPELYNYGRNNLKVDYIFWVRYKNPKGSDHYNYTHALSTISNNIGFNK